MFWTTSRKVAWTRFFGTRARNLVSLYGKVGYFMRKKPKISLTENCLMYFSALFPYPIETLSPGHSRQIGLVRQKSETFSGHSV